MEKFPHEEFRDFAVEMINWGGSVRLKRTKTNTGTEYKPVWTNTDTEIVGVMSGYSTHEIDGTLIKWADQKLMTYDELKAGEQLVDSDGVVYTIGIVKRERPADITMYYEVQLKR